MNKTLKVITSAVASLVTTSITTNCSYLLASYFKLNFYLLLAVCFGASLFYGYFKGYMQILNNKEKLTKSAKEEIEEIS